MRTLLRQTKDKSPVQLRPGGFRLKRTQRQRRSGMMDGPPLIVLREPREAISSVAETAEPPPAQRAGSDTLQLYLREIGQVRLITPEEENAPWRRIKQS